MISVLKLERPRNGIVVLDGVRALACLIVIGYHINLATKEGNSPERLGVWSPSDIGPLLGTIVNVGWSGVTLFFVLSGFLLFMPYARALLFDTPWPSIRQFYLRRALRIWPGYFVSLFLLILLTHPEYFQPDRWKETLLFLTFFMDSSSATYDHLNGPYWTLAVEWQFYMLLPLLVWGMRFIVQRGTLHRRLWLLTGCLLALVIWGLAMRLIFWHYSWARTPSPDHPLFSVAQFFLYGKNGKYLEDFAVGMGISMWYVLAQHSTLEHRLVAWFRHHALWLWQGGLLWLALMALWPLFPGAAHWLLPHLGAHRWLADFGFALGFGTCILALLFGPEELRRPLEWRPLCGLGLLSYALYIWHVPLIRAILPFFAPLADTIPAFPLYCLFWLGASLVILPFCYLFYCLIEQPWMRVSNFWTKKHAQKQRPQQIQTS